MRKYLYNHNCENTAYVVENYPWGFRLKTKQRYWIETNNKKNGGQRLVTQTLNPKNNKWCAPKKSTYDSVAFLYLDENNHVKVEAIHISGLGCEEKGKKIKEFAETHKEYLTDYQKKELRLLDGYNKAYQNVKFTFENVPFNETDAEKEERKLKKEEAQNTISKMVKYYTINSNIV